MENKLFNLIEDVVDPGYCIGCGVCKTVASEKISLKLDQDGFYTPQLSELLNVQENEIASKICPFSNYADNETDIGRRLFGGMNEFDDKLGYINSCNAIRVQEGEFRNNGTSSGFTSWILCELLKRNLVDAVIHVGDSVAEESNQSAYFKYKISTTTDEVMSKSKTRYYPVEVGSVLSSLQNDNRRFAIVGLPCFIKSIQLLRKTSFEWENRIRFTVSIFCGHLKSSLFTENLLLAMKVDSRKIETLDYRRKLEGNPANVYIMGVKVKGGWIDRDMSEVPGSDWGSGAFKYYACNFCDDVVGETSDVSVGDAWLPQYKSDGGGTNNVIARNHVINQIIEEGKCSNKLWVESLTVEDVHKSTRGGFEDRRPGTAYRVSLEREAGFNPPTKRVYKFDKTDKQRLEVFAFKMLIGMISVSLYQSCRRLRSEYAFRKIIRILTICYRKRWPGIFFKVGFFSYITKNEVKRRKQNNNKRSDL